MKKVVLLEPCLYTRYGLVELLSQCHNAELIAAECDYQDNAYTLLNFLETIDFDVLVLGEKSTLIGFSSDMEFIHYFYQLFGSRKKLLLLANRINLNLLGCVYGLQVETVDKHSAVAEVMDHVRGLLDDSQYGIVSRVNSRLLTPMQRRVLVSYLKGIPMAAVARSCGKSPKTLSSHKRAAMKTLGVSRPHQLLKLNKKRITAREASLKH